MGEKITKGDLFLFTSHYDNGRSVHYYGSLVEIIGIASNSIMMVTGEGDLNTKEKLLIRIIKDNNFKDIDSSKFSKTLVKDLKIKFKFNLENDTIEADSHDVHKINIDYGLVEIDKKIDRLLKEKTFYNDFHIRTRKLRKLLDDSND